MLDIHALMDHRKNSFISTKELVGFWAFLFESYFLEVCQPLFYKGCGGNGNRYESAVECREKCLNEGTKRTGSTSGENETEMKLVLKAGHEQWTHGRFQWI